MKSIAVFCASSPGNSSTLPNEVFLLGQEIARKKLTLIYGGANVGLMGCLANGVLSQGGKVIGVLPRFLADREIAHPELTEIIYVGTMQERQRKIHELSDASITLPGGYGSMEEIFEKLSSKQLGLHSQPVAIWNILGFYDHLISQMEQMVALGFLKRKAFNELIVEKSPNDLLTRIIGQLN